MNKATTVAALGLALTLGISGCGGTGTSATSPEAAPSADQKITLTVWAKFKDRELEAFNSALDKFESAHPNIAIESQGGQDDEKITQAIRGGNAPDVALSTNANNLGQFCSSGSFQDLKPYLERDNFDLNQFPEATRAYTTFGGTRCAMPLLADTFGLYYNKKLFAEAGISSPPKTMSELNAAAKKLTQFNADGSIKVAGFIPTPGFYENRVQMYAPLFGADWVDESGKSAVAKDPGWKEMLNWQKDLTKELGADKLSKFVAGAGQEFSADHAFQTGSLAMMLDGEWRTAFIKDEAPGLDYATAPFPVADSSPELYGTTYTSGNILGIPKGAKNAGAAWELVKFLATDNKALTGLADSLQNVPTTTQALESAKDEATPQFKTFIDLFGGKMQSNPSSANGGGYLKTMQDFALNYATGRTQDLDGGLADVAKQIDDSATLGR